ncbi:UbiA family prenyltransferase [Methylobacter psychrophilus]|uniref:UbiA family prenyltransferase n=1 Tax=Methylobacter psychrophilus TaxID=96941 RepID=UPI0021D4B0AE|nr:UbiA family prenyltransferase [Methylobacter psychrophilus]
MSKKITQQQPLSNKSKVLADSVPLFVDLDGTLIKTDLLIESTFIVLKKQPWMLLVMLYWLVFGIARLKEEIAVRAVMDFRVLPLQKEFIAFLKNEARQGRALYLATASDRGLAEPVAKQLGFFKQVLASDGHRNLKGSNKLEAILTCCNDAAFDYAGNARADLAIWAKARRAIIVNPDVGVTAAVRRRRYRVEKVFDDRPPRIKTWLRAFRLHQWGKNVLLGVPVFTAHVFDFSAITQVLMAFMAFGLIASATYLLNELFDVAADRHHPRKYKRPFAAGDIGLDAGVLGMVILFGAGLGLAAQISNDFLLILLAYFGLTVGYSFYFKRFALIDVLLLAILYTFRIIAGAYAIEVPVSSGLLEFSLFIFLSLALVKRCSELIAIQSGSLETVKGRDYRVSDYPVLGVMGIAAGYISILVLALFIGSPESAAEYTYPDLLWLLCPLMAYWVSRLWLKTARGQMHDDPLVFSLKDQASWIVLIMILMVTLVSI